jgi:dTDP-4-amino-4,6-dideoxygalactose transaminase
VKAGDEVITVSHSFIATANAVRYCSAVPVFVDVDAQTFNIDPDLIEGAISERTRAVLCVHQLGMPCDLSRIVPTARRYNLRVIEDAACAIGSEIEVDGEWQRIGRPHGDIACFSFHPRKVLSTGDGGMLTTADESLDRQFRSLRQHGMTISDVARHAASTVLFEEYPVVGFNYRMTDIQAAIGREQLKRLDQVVPVRRARAARYSAALTDAADILTPAEPAWARSNWQSYTVTLGSALRQRDLMQALLNAGIATRRPAMNAHREGAYASGGWRRGSASLERSEAVQDTALVLPLYHAMTDADQDRVIEELRRCSR